MNPGDELKQIDAEIAALKKRIRELEARGVELLPHAIAQAATEESKDERKIKICLVALAIMLLLSGVMWALFR